MECSILRRSGLALLALLAMCAPARSQSSVSQSQLPPRVNTANLSGPRFGITLVPDGMIHNLATKNIEVGPQISQFGWQFEKQFFAKDSGVTMVSEWVALAGGLEQNLFVPTLSWVMGVRTHDGAEFGMGPIISPGGSGLVLATRMTFRAGGFNIPVNIAAVPSKQGTRVTLLTGLSLRK